MPAALAVLRRVFFQLAGLREGRSPPLKQPLHQQPESACNGEQTGRPRRTVPAQFSSLSQNESLLSLLGTFLSESNQEDVERYCSQTD